MRAAAAFAFLSLAAACGDSGSGTGGGTSTGGAGGSVGDGGGGGGGGPPVESCTRPGALGNELGVGEYCTPLGGECSDNSDAQLCLADVGQTEWMCTRISCDATTDCGEGAGCLLNAAGSACVPCACDSAGIGCSGGTGGGGVGGAGGN